MSEEEYEDLEYGGGYLDDERDTRILFGLPLRETTDEEKAMLIQPLFALTAEEINVVKEGLSLYGDYLEVYKFNHKKMSDEEVIKIQNELETISNLQIKIHDYQNGKEV